MALSDFDPGEYTRSPNFDLASGITLAKTLVQSSPADMPKPVRKSASKLAATASRAEDALAARQRALTVTEEDSRVVDVVADSSWSALRMRLVSYAVLPADRYPLAPRAAELVAVLFGDGGLDFLKDPYPMQLATAATILKRIDEDGLHADIDAIAGSEFLDHIRTQHKVYGEMVTAMLTRDKAAGAVNLTEHKIALQRAIVDYATKVCATVDEDEPESITIARTALRPIDTFRELTRDTGGSSKPPTDPGSGGTSPGSGTGTGGGTGGTAGSSTAAGTGSAAGSSTAAGTGSAAVANGGQIAGQAGPSGTESPASQNPAR